MFPKRSLLYHRGVDDHAGTYVTDYIFSGVCFILCVQLIIRIRRERKRSSTEGGLTPQCEKSSNWYPWNWPRPEVTPITMTTYALLMLGMSNIPMTLLGGLTHQFLQTVEPYEDINDLRNWLIIWRTGASFSAFVCLSLFIMTEQLLTQEGILHLSRPIRVAYYIIALVITGSFFAYNYIPLIGGEDPFSIGPSFMVFFIVMFIYAVATTIVFIRACCCTSQSTFDNKGYRAPSSVTASHKRPENNRYRNELYTCCKTVVIRCHDSDDVARDGITDRRLELLLTFLSPWMFVSAGIMNHFLKSKCADSDDAFRELGCPLPNAFNHNAAMHVIQIISIILFFLAENMAITKRMNRVSSDAFKRIITSSTMKSEVIDSCEVIYTESEEGRERELSLKKELLNNNETNRDDDVICNMTLPDAVDDGCHQNKLFTSQCESDVDSGIDDLHRTGGEPKFPTYDYDVMHGENRCSVYDNLSNTVCHDV